MSAFETPPERKPPLLCSWAWKGRRILSLVLPRGCGCADRSFHQRRDAFPCIVFVPRFPPRAFCFPPPPPLVRCLVARGVDLFLSWAATPRPLAMEAAGCSLVLYLLDGLSIVYPPPPPPPDIRTCTRAHPPPNRSILKTLADADLSSLSLSELCTAAIDAVLEIVKDEEVCDLLTRRSVLFVQWFRALFFCSASLAGGRRWFFCQGEKSQSQSFWYLDRNVKFYPRVVPVACPVIDVVCYEGRERERET